LYVFGGSSAEDYVSLNDRWEYALGTHVWTQVVSTGGSAPSLCWDHSLIALGNRLLVFGGCDESTDFASSALHCFDLQRRRWSDLAVSGVFPPARAYHVAIPYGGGVIIFGGVGSADEFLNDTVLLRVWP